MSNYVGLAPGSGKKKDCRPHACYRAAKTYKEKAK